MKLRTMELLVAVLAAAGIYCAYRYYRDIYLPDRQLDRAVREQLELFDHMRPQTELTASEASTLDENKAAGTSAPHRAEGEKATEEAENPLAPCEEVNDRTVGWIYIPGTNIDFPIVQGEDNDFYLHNGVDGQYNYELGCPFLDCRCAADFSGFNSIVYAHNMTERRMFADIALFQEQSFLEGHSVGYLTLTDGTHLVDFFAYISAPSSAQIYQTEFFSDYDRNGYLDYLNTYAKYLIGNTADEQSRLLLLSTCTFEYDEARGVLVGVIGETIQ